MLDQLLGYYAYPSHASQLLDVLNDLLQAAAIRLGPASENHTLRDPEFMVVHALNMIAPQNWQDTTITMNDGTIVPGKQFVMPAAEASHLERLGEDHENRNADKAMRAAINAAVGDPGRSTEEFHLKALEFVRRPAEMSSQTEKEVIPGDLSPQEEDSIKVAFLLARDGSPTLRQEHSGWIRETLAQSFSERERETHRYRSEYKFNPQAFSFAGYVSLLKHERTATNIRGILDAAGFSNPSAAAGFKAIGAALAEEDERLIRSILRCAFTARITPTRDWRAS